MIKVLIVDDSALVRQTFKTLLETDPQIKVIGTASDPYSAVKKIQKEKPDVITLDIEMPKMDGITFLQKLMRQVSIPVIIISNQTVKGADVALKALENGAVDVLTKPNLSTDQLMEESRVLLIDKIKSAFYAGSKKKASSISSPSSSIKTNHGQFDDHVFNNTVIAVGASTGGTEAIRQFLEGLPADMPPILIVQHMPEKFTSSFAQRLNNLCKLRVKEAEHNELVLPRTVYIAPGNHHMSIISSAGKKYIQITDGDLVNRHRPSVNVLFNSVATYMGKRSIGVILTGMGDDGATGMKAMFDKGAYTIAQNEDTSVVYGMPLKAVREGGVIDILPLYEIAPNVCDFLTKN